MSISDASDTLTINLGAEAQRLIRRYREAYCKALETPETQRGSKNVYKKRMADMDVAARDLALWVEVISKQAERSKN